jgi:ATP-dependent helicase/nuclease subunit B
VGTLASATGLPFTAVRVLGLCEGRLPSIPSEDPVLPEAAELRRLLPEAAIAEAGDRVLGQLHALDRVVRDTSARVALSAPRRDVMRTDREPSAVFIEAAAAIARATTTGETTPTVPNMAALRRDYFNRARAAAEEFRRDHPLTSGAWQDRVALAGGLLPASWDGVAAVDLARIRSLTTRPPDTAHGLLGPDGAIPPLPGLNADHPISASTVRMLLECPHRFFLEKVLGLRVAAAPPATGAIDTLPYGSLFHGIAERFAREHGAEFNARRRSKGEWQTIARQIASAAFEDLVEEYPLSGGAVKGQQLAFLLRQVEDFVEHDWNGGTPRTYVGAEIPFGYAAPMGLRVGRSKLYVHGFIDRIDQDAGATLVRDLKTGRAHPRRGAEELPTPALDVQIALYGLVVKELASELGLPARVGAAYTYIDRRGLEERSFRDDFDELAGAAREWLAIAHGLLEERAFPRALSEESCRYCKFGLLCDDDRHARAALLEGRPGAVGAFYKLQAPEPAPQPDGGDAASEEEAP